jgi:hypothetical protein
MIMQWKYTSHKEKLSSITINDPLVIQQYTTIRISMKFQQFKVLSKKNRRENQ